MFTVVSRVAPASHIAHLPVHQPLSMGRQAHWLHVIYKGERERDIARMCVNQGRRERWRDRQNVCRELAEIQ